MSEAIDPPQFQGPSHEPAAIALAVLSGLAFVLILQPFAWHTKHRNMPAASLILWLLILNLINFTNALIWPNDDMQNWFSGHGVCDIQVKITVGSYAGVNTALCAIARSLAIILDSRKVGSVPTPAQKRRELAIQWLLVWGCPVYLMVVHYIVQPNRYFLFAIAGCNPSVDNSWVTIVLILIWPPIFALLSCYYAALLVWRLHKYRQEFSRIMTLNKTTKSRFIRLFSLSAFLILVFVPLSIWVFYTNLDADYHAYSWDQIHSRYWGVVMPIPTDGQVLYDRWFRPAAAIITFAFFGIGSDAVAMYKGGLVKLGLGRIFPSLNPQRFSGVGGSRFSSGHTSSSQGLIKRFKDKHFSSKSQGASHVAATDASTLARTSISTSDCGTEKGFSKHLNSPTSPTSLPSPVRLAVDRGAVAVKTNVSVEEKERNPACSKSVWEV